MANTSREDYFDVWRVVRSMEGVEICRRYFEEPSLARTTRPFRSPWFLIEINGIAVLPD
jgi:hypothetical protein